MRRSRQLNLKRVLGSGAFGWGALWTGTGDLPGQADIRERLRDILGRPEFAPPQPSFWERALQWLGERLNDLLSLFIDENGRADVLLIVLAAVLVAALVYLIVRLVRRRAPPRQAAPSAPAPTLKDDSSQELLRHADRLYESDAVCDAFSFLLYAHLKALSETGVLTLTPGRTNRQYYTDIVRADTRAAAVFSAFCLAFNERRYGDTPALPEDYRLWRGRLFGGREAASA